MPALVTGPRQTRGGTIRQGITLAGIDVVIVALTLEDVRLVRETAEWAVEQHGPRVLTRAGHPPVQGDQPMTAPVVDGARLVGYVELAP